MLRTRSRCKVSEDGLTTTRSRSDRDNEVGHGEVLNKGEEAAETGATAKRLGKLWANDMEKHEGVGSRGSDR